VKDPDEILGNNINWYIEKLKYRKYENDITQREIFF
jgi:hypothetical protein